MKSWYGILVLVCLVSATQAAAQALPFRIMQQERMPKGGRYVLLVVNTVITEPHPTLTKPLVEATLREAYRTVRADVQRPGNAIDGITLRVWGSVAAMQKGSPAFGVVEWWPKGHSFEPSNAANIQNKATYVETVEVSAMSFPDKPFSVVVRLPEATRRKIFIEALQVENKATREAEARHPTHAATMQATYTNYESLKALLTRNGLEEERLLTHYNQSLRRKYKISEAELQEIKVEGVTQQWPY